MQFVANLKFKEDEAEFERLYNEYKEAKGRLIGYLQKEGISFNDGAFERKQRRIDIGTKLN